MSDITETALALFSLDASWIFEADSFKNRRRELRLCFGGDFKVLLINRGVQQLYRGTDKKTAVEVFNGAFEEK